MLNVIDFDQKLAGNKSSHHEYFHSLTLVVVRIRRSQRWEKRENYTSSNRNDVVNRVFIDGRLDQIRFEKIR